MIVVNRKMLKYSIKFARVDCLWDCFSSNVLLATVNCVRWSSNGEFLASASDDKTVALIDLRSEKVIHIDTTSDGSNIYYVNFL